jgi:thiol:disulfide interchange protein DsbC
MATPLRYRLLAAVLILGVPFVTVAGDGPAEPSSASGLRDLLRGIEGLQRLPVTGLQMVRAGGRVLFVSANGRYVFTGPAWDLWHGAALTSIEEAGRLAESVDLTRMGLDPAALGALDLGTADRDALVFVDPHCPHCQALLSALPALTGRYRFRLVPLPVLGPDSETTVVRLACLAERDPTAARTALLEHTLEALLPAEGRCGQGSAQRAVVAAQLLGIEAVPYLIAPDGRTHRGAPADLAAWLEGSP